MEKKKLYLGLDLGAKYALLSYYIPSMTEPDTVSAVAGSEIYQIPTVLTKKRGLGQWYYGQEAVDLAEQGGGEGCERLLVRALAQERIQIGQEEYDAVDLLALFLKKLLQIPHKFGAGYELSYITVTLHTLSMDKMNLVHSLMEKLHVEKKQYQVIDYRESFYYYALNQRQELMLHDVVLFDYSDVNMFFYRLERSRQSALQLTQVTEQDLGPLLGNKDIAFADVVKAALAKKIYSAIYLTGDGFDGEWMQESLAYLCQGRRVFLGKNLYVKGACYASMVKGGQRLWNYAYIGEHVMKMNISLKVLNRGEMIFFPLIKAGENRFEAKRGCEILINGANVIDFWIQKPQSREAKIETLELTDLPQRPERMCRIGIFVEAVSDSRVKVEIQDLGFGELYRSSEKTWNCEMGL